jgi:hypothetical protein
MSLLGRYVGWRTSEVEMAKYKVLVGLDYSGKRAESGAVINDLPAKSIKWLREQGLIVLISGEEPVDEPKVDKPSAETVVEENE